MLPRMFQELRQGRMNGAYQYLSRNPHHFVHPSYASISHSLIGMSPWTASSASGKVYPYTFHSYFTFSPTLHVSSPTLHLASTFSMLLLALTGARNRKLYLLLIKLYSFSPMPPPFGFLSLHVHHQSEIFRLSKTLPSALPSDAL